MVGSKSFLNSKNRLEGQNSLPLHLLLYSSLFDDIVAHPQSVLVNGYKVRHILFGLSVNLLLNLVLIVLGLGHKVKFFLVVFFFFNANFINDCDIDQFVFY